MSAVIDNTLSTVILRDRAATRLRAHLDRLDDEAYEAAAVGNWKRDRYIQHIKGRMLSGTFGQPDPVATAWTRLSGSWRQTA